MTIYTAIFSDYDSLKHPLIITKDWKYVVFTDQDITSHFWTVKKVPLIGNDPVLTARFYKIMFHLHIEDEFSLWVDGSFTIACDLDKFMMSNFKSPFTVVKHPLRNCIYREADICIQQHRGDRKKIEAQIEAYRGKVDKQSGLIQSGILIRENQWWVRSFMECWWEQVQKFSTRDQIGFSFAAKIMGWPHQIKFDYRVSKEFRYKKHLNYQRSRA